MFQLAHILNKKRMWRDLESVGGKEAVRLRDSLLHINGLLTTVNKQGPRSRARFDQTFRASLDWLKGEVCCMGLTDRQRADFMGAVRILETAHNNESINDRELDRWIGHVGPLIRSLDTRFTREGNRQGQMSLYCLSSLFNLAEGISLEDEPLLRVVPGFMVSTSPHSQIHRFLTFLLILLILLATVLNIYGANESFRYVAFAAIMDVALLSAHLLYWIAFDHYSFREWVTALLSGFLDRKLRPNFTGFSLKRSLYEEAIRDREREVERLEKEQALHPEDPNVEIDLRLAQENLEMLKRLPPDSSPPPI